jgi:carbamate kinase
MYDPAADRQLVGVEAVIDKDLASSLLARDLGADLFIMATDVDGVYADWGTPDQRRLEHVAADELGAMEFAAGSMGPKVQAAVEFATAGDGRSVIGSLEQIDGLVAGTAGTNVTSKESPS